jgi:N-hydroxyarylamine O-acetyltransferase
VSANAIDRYLRLLGVPRRAPAIEALTELVRAQVERIPFENLTKLYRFRRAGLTGLPGLEEHLEGVERFRLGGTCYANAVHLHALLVELGYDVRLCGADMAEPDVHVVNLVALDGREFLVDAGYGAPFLVPFPIDGAGDQSVTLGRSRFVIHPRDRDGSVTVDHLRDGRAWHGYRVRPVPRQVAHFREVIARSFRPDAEFMNALVLIRFSGGRCRTIRNLSLIDAWDDQEVRRPIAGTDALVQLAESGFGVPREVTAAALEVVGEKLATAAARA